MARSVSVRGTVFAACLIGAVGCGGDGSGSPGGSGGRGGAAGAQGGSGGTAGTSSAGGASGGSAGGSGGSTVGAGGGGGIAGAASGGSGGGTGGAVAGAGGAAGGTAGAAGGTAGAGGAAGFGLGGPSRCASANVLFCEDFENGLDAATWSTGKAGDASLVVDATHAARGSKALHVSTTSGAGHAFITEKKGFPVANNTLYGRMYVWFEDALTTDGHFTLAEGQGADNPAWIRFGGQFKKYGVGTDHGSSGDWTDVDDKLIPTKTWMCMQFLFNGPTNEFQVWWDDAERPKLKTGPSRHATFKMPTFASLWFGYWMYNAQEPQEVWIDEIAVDAKPIPCSK